MKNRNTTYSVPKREIMTRLTINRRKQEASCWSKYQTFTSSSDKQKKSREKNTRLSQWTYNYGNSKYRGCFKVLYSALRYKNNLFIKQEPKQGRKYSISLSWTCISGYNGTSCSKWCIRQCKNTILVTITTASESSLLMGYGDHKETSRKGTSCCRNASIRSTCLRCSSHIIMSNCPQRVRRDAHTNRNTKMKHLTEGQMSNAT